jgi:hypothetical protein
MMAVTTAKKEIASRRFVLVINTPVSIHEILHAHRARIKEIHNASEMERLDSYNGTGLGWKGL